MIRKITGSLRSSLDHLTDNQLLACAWPWWRYSDHADSIESATRMAFLVPWGDGIEQALDANEGTGRPSTHRRLIRELQLDEKHFRRKYLPNKSKPTGKTQSESTSRRSSVRQKEIAGTRLRYDVAQSLGVPEASLAPELPEYVAWSAVWLVTLDKNPEWETGQPYAVEFPAALAYALVVLRRIDDRGRAMSKDTIAALARDLKGCGAGDPIQSFCDTAEVVGTVLRETTIVWKTAIPEWESPVVSGLGDATLS